MQRQKLEATLDRSIAHRSMLTQCSTKVSHKDTARTKREKKGTVQCDGFGFTPSNHLMVGMKRRKRKDGNQTDDEVPCLLRAL